MRLKKTFFFWPNLVIFKTIDNELIKIENGHNFFPFLSNLTFSVLLIDILNICECPKILQGNIWKGCQLYGYILKIF